jgi:hypothetical protein
MGILLITQILVAHWIADFLLQSSWMATNKSKSWLALSSHVVTYTATIAFLMLFFSIALVGLGIEHDLSNSVIFESTPYAFAMWVIINGLLHFVTDAVTSRISSKLWERGDMRRFFIVIGFDQMIHYLCLFGTASLLLL